MDNPIRSELARAELDSLGMKYFLDVRATLRRMLEGLGQPERTAFAAAVAERLLREDEELPPGEYRGYLATWRPVLDAVWQGLAGDPAGTRAVARALAGYYLRPEFGRRHDDPADADDHATMAVCYAAECHLHGCLEFALWAGWRGFDAATIRAAADQSWPHRRPPRISGYAWELAHPGVQAELDRQLEDLELLDESGAAGLLQVTRPAPTAAAPAPGTPRLPDSPRLPGTPPIPGSSSVPGTGSPAPTRGAPESGRRRIS